MFDLSIVFMQNAFKIWRHHSLMLHPCETFCQALVLSAGQIANKYNACCCPVHCCSRFSSAICPD